MRSVLVAEHDPQLLRALDMALRAQHYTVHIAQDGETALRLVSCRLPDALILDLGLPGTAGTDLIRGVRAWSPLPIIALSGHTHPADTVKVLDAGADDCLIKPFAVEELAARLRAALRRPPVLQQPDAVDIASWRVDLGAYRIAPRSGEGEAPHLTPTEWRVLALLLRHPGRLITGQQLLRDVWGPGYESRSNYLRIYLAGLRRKLEPEPARPRHLITVPGLGYRFEP
ncbi:response regulator [Streptomyces sp. GMR22]|uniref:response regulator n=1 Tax=Streptomyces sp. GMR22 TaxID=2759524 RepID=UPI0015FB4A1B|nr:response regulator [Streptomyces sp. GMR22]MBA6434726.1 response regulator [Streptomyces sp. GMR22]